MHRGENIGRKKVWGLAMKNGKCIVWKVSIAQERFLQETKICN